MSDELIKKEENAIQVQVDALLESRKYFIDKVLPILKENQDFYVIKNKKSLAKGGAEKLASIFNLSASFEVDKDTMGLLTVQGLVAYVCNLTGVDGRARGQGRGADTLARNQNDPNKTIKMAQKRAFVDAVIRATGLSDIFTQDLEDMDLKSDFAKEVEPLMESNEPTYVDEAAPQKQCPVCKKWHSGRYSKCFDCWKAEKDGGAKPAAKTKTIINQDAEPFK